MVEDLEELVAKDARTLSVGEDGVLRVEISDNLKGVDIKVNGCVFRLTRKDIESLLRKFVVWLQTREGEL